MTRDIIEPVPMGDFNSIDELLLLIEERKERSEPLYGHAIIYQKDKNGIMQRIGARVNDEGEVTVGAHCEWI